MVQNLYNNYAWQNRMCKLQILLCPDSVSLFNILICHRYAEFNMLVMQLAFYPPVTEVLRERQAEA
jgi:hypothetical protein